MQQSAYMIDPILSLKAELQGRTLRELAADIGCSPQFLHQIINRQRPASDSVLRYLGLRKVTAYERVPKR